MDNINTQSGERLSFYKLFCEKNYRVLIPIIQRDYAQGRKSTKEVRDTFIEALYRYLEENKPNRDLDFVYGSLSNDDRDVNFIPLDGQQRLTTLFLLHWYLYQISTDIKSKEEFKAALFVDGKSKFSYETRSSSSEFCDAIMANDIDFEKLTAVNGVSKDNALSRAIKNRPWFYLSWQYDPTIQSMLTMLDAIHKRFCNNPEFFGRLIDTENPVITFLFLNLRDFKLTDDLYIKMNSRGKPLTAFENFKAKLEQYLETVKHERKITLKYGSEQHEQEVSLKDYFSYNIDTKWANLFWNYRSIYSRSKTDSDDTFDDELMNFIRIIFTNQYAMDVDVTLKDKDDALEYLLGTQVAKKHQEYSDVISFNKYEELQALSEEGVFYLIDALDILANGSEKIKSYLDHYKFYFNENEVFEHALKHDQRFSNQERVCFHAYLRFLIYHKGNTDGIDQWMRIVHNLTHPENTVIDNASEVAAAIKSIEELLPYSNDILDYLMNNPNISRFSTWQVFEEKIKAHLITKNGIWQNKIEWIEQHNYFNGQIGFMLGFAGVVGYYSINKHCNWTDSEDTNYFKAFSDYANKACQIFADSYENRVNDKDYVFERAVLTKGDYLTEASQYRNNLLSTNLVKNNIKRDHSWKRVLRISDDGTLTFRHMIIKKVFDDPRLDVTDIVKSLNVICGDRTNSWRDYFIDCPDLIKYCNQGFIRFENENAIRLYGESQSNHIHVEMYSYYLWKKYINPHKNSFLPFSDISYYDVKSIEDEPCVLLSGFSHNRIKYQIEIYHLDNTTSQYQYEMWFLKSEGENSQEGFDDNIKAVLSQCNFKWNNSGYSYKSSDVEDLIQNLKQATEMMVKI